MDRILVTGGRYLNPIIVKNILNDIFKNDKDIFIIHGCATGADTGAQLFADENKIPFKRFPADWNRYGKAAGYIRNKEMLDKGLPDYIIAFPGGRGTANMIKLALDKKIRIRYISEAEMISDKLGGSP